MPLTPGRVFDFEEAALNHRMPANADLRRSATRCSPSPVSRASASIRSLEGLAALERPDERPASRVHEVVDTGVLVVGVPPRHPRSREVPPVGCGSSSIGAPLGDPERGNPRTMVNEPVAEGVQLFL